MSDVVPDVGRHAVLVDAGYLYASVGQLVLGRTSRREFRVATEPLIGALLARADRTSRGELLRMYWYDAARDRVPTVEQRQIAALPHVKVRLGNLNSAGQQKGVDAQLRQDLELLARHRAVSDVVLIAGDEDMVPAVEAAQAYGVRVHVWGVEPPYGVNQAERLVWEADTVDQLDAEFCRPYVEVEPAAVEEAVEPEPREDKPAVPTPAEVFAARKLQAPMPKPVAVAPVPSDRPGPERPEMEQIGARIAARWLLTRGRENIADLLPGPVLPTVIDKELLVEAEEEISRSLRPYEEARRALRDGFWAKLHKEFGIQLASVSPHPTADHHQPVTPPSGHPGPAPPNPPPPTRVAAAPVHSGPAAQAHPGSAIRPTPASPPRASPGLRLRPSRVRRPRRTRSSPAHPGPVGRAHAVHVGPTQTPSGPAARHCPARLLRPPPARWARRIRARPPRRSPAWRPGRSRAWRPGRIRVGGRAAVRVGGRAAVRVGGRAAVGVGGRAEAGPAGPQSGSAAGPQSGSAAPTQSGAAVGPAPLGRCGRPSERRSTGTDSLAAGGRGRPEAGRRRPARPFRRRLRPCRQRARARAGRRRIHRRRAGSAP